MKDVGHRSWPSPQPTGKRGRRVAAVMDGDGAESKWKESSNFYSRETSVKKVKYEHKRLYIHPLGTKWQSVSAVLGYVGTPIPIQLTLALSRAHHPYLSVMT